MLKQRFDDITFNKLWNNERLIKYRNFDFENEPFIRFFYEGKSFLITKDSSIIECENFYDKFMNFENIK